MSETSAGRDLAPQTKRATSADLGADRESVAPRSSIEVQLPAHLRTLAGLNGPAFLEVAEPPTIGAVLHALEVSYPVLRGAIRDHGTLRRRPFVRFFACEEDLSFAPPETPLPEPIASGREPFLIIGAMAGG